MGPKRQRLGDMATSQGMLSATRSKEGSSPTASEGSVALQMPQLQTSSSTIMREYICVVLSHKIVVICYGSPRKPTHPSVSHGQFPPRNLLLGHWLVPQLRREQMGCHFVVQQQQDLGIGPEPLPARSACQQGQAAST